MKLTIMGRGRVGLGLRRGLRGTGIDVTLISHQSTRAIVCDVLLLAVPEHALEELAKSLTQRALPPRLVVLHAAGAINAQVLRPLARQGHPTGVLHPLVSFPSRKQSPTLKGTYWTLTGEARAVTAGKRIAKSAGARPIVFQGHGPAYHAAATLVAAGTAALIHQGTDIMAKAGMNKIDAEHALVALASTVLENASALGIPKALSGPVARGDAQAVASHRTALSGSSREAYDAVTKFIRGLSAAAKRDA